jgi:serine/threonine-protein kinase RsbW
MPDAEWIWQCERLIPSDAGAGRAVEEEILEQLRRHDWSEHDRFCIVLAFEEALVNAIKHGNRYDAGKQVRVVCRLSPRLLRIEITDQGSGFDPKSLPDPTLPYRLECPTGRGVMLIHKFMSRVTYSPIGNQVILEKDRNGPGLQQDAAKPG